jgi:hypothetical protein
MSSSGTSAAWVNNGVSGGWTTAGEWTPAAVPGAGANVSIGSAATNLAVPWTVTVAGNQAAGSLTLDMGQSGALSITGALDDSGTANLGAASAGGATVDLGAGASLTVGGNLAAISSTFQVNGGTISTGGFADLSKGTIDIGSGGVWNAASLWDGLFYTASVDITAGGRLAVSGPLNVGFDATKTSDTEGIGSLIATGGGVVTAAMLDVVNTSMVEVDGSSGIVVGSGSSVPGAVAVEKGATLALEAATVSANVVDDGLLAAYLNPSAAAYSAGSGPVITGTLSGDGGVAISGGYTLDVGNAAGFTGAILIASGGTLRINAGAAPTGYIDMAGGTLDLRGLSFASGPTIGYTGSTLTVGGESIDVGSGFSLTRFAVSADGAGGTQVTLTPCYAAGTRIATEAGETRVELLRPGMHVRTAGGRLAPVLWVGQRTVDVRAAPHLAPVRIDMGAFAPGLPRRDLLLSPDHAVSVGEVLMQARALVNGATIRQDATLPAITYVHVELDRHDLLLAEGLAAESYLDTGNRGQFQGTGAPAYGEADPVAEAAALQAFAERGCAKLVLRGPEVAAAQARLRARASAMGWCLVEDPALGFVADRPGLHVVQDGPQTLQVLLPAGTRHVRLVSRSFIPEVLDPAIPDGRQLGVAVAAELDGTWLEEAAFGRGWYPPDAGVQWRWTDGDAELVLPAHDRPVVLTVHLLAAGGRYWVRQAVTTRAA